MFDTVSFEERNVFDETTGQYKKEFIAHYGTPRHSGRYPWGSGKNPQRHRNWLQRAEDLEKQGLSRVDVAKAMGLSSGDYISMKSYYKDMKRAEDRLQAKKWFNKGVSKSEIARRLNISEGQVRNYLNEHIEYKESKAKTVANALKEMLDEKPFIDIGEGVPKQLGISDEMMRKAALYLKAEGCSIIDYDLPQVSNPSQKTHLKVLAKEGSTRADLRENIVKLTSPDGIYFEDYGATLVKTKPVENIDSKRIKVNYTETGGGDKDGVIEVRPGVEDLALGTRNYAQVRIAVDGTHYLKGMAVYGDPKTMPPGIDIVFNTSKHSTVPMLGHGDNTVLKEMKNDPQNPFGSAFRQWDYQDSSGETHLSPINIVNDDEDWKKWKKNLSSQFLSKQPAPLIRQQLDLKYSELKEEFDDLKSITNPTLKKEFLSEFADKCESAAEHLNAAALPRQGSFAILPVTSLKDNEVYAPMYEPGEEVVLVRYPHAGTFEMPRLIVNNANQEGKTVVGKDARHAIGINAAVAKQLSGADYDGDTVLVIPTKGQKIFTRPPLEGLKDFDHMELYSRSPDDPQRTGKTTYNSDGSVDKIGDKFNKGLQMGIVSNLITDMTIKGADWPEIERAVKYSMVVIDAEKHNLDWKLARRDNGIEELQQRWQRKDDDRYGGASTLISKAGAEARIPERKELPYYKIKNDPELLKRYQQGEKIYEITGRKYPEKKEITDPKKMTEAEIERYNSGKRVFRKTGKILDAPTVTTGMDSVDDAYELSSGTLKEGIYAAHANRLKALANEARKIERATVPIKKNKSAAVEYEDVIGPEGTLTKKLLLAEKEVPKDRQAQAIATSIMDAAFEANPEYREKDYKDKRKKIAAKAIETARDLVNGGEHKKRFRIELTDREWEAIQAGAISDDVLRQRVIRYSDKEALKKRALPKRTGMKASSKSRARLLYKAGWTTAEIAKELGVSWSTLEKEGLIPGSNGGE